MEFKSFAESEKRKDLDGHTVRDLSSTKYGIDNQRIAVERRRPEKGYLRNGLGLLMVQVLNRNGHLLLNTSEGEKSTAIHNGDTLYIEPGEDYAFEGSMEIMHVELPVSPTDAPEYIEEN